MAPRFVVVMAAAVLWLSGSVANAQVLFYGESPAYQQAMNDVYSYLTPGAGPDGWRQPTSGAASRLSPNLTTLSDADLIRRNNPYGSGEEILMTNMSDFSGYSSVSYRGQPYPDMWYVAAPQLHNYLTNPLNHIDPAEVAARLYQLHGMPDNRQLDRIVEFWVPDSALYRPAINPDPTSQITSTNVVLPSSWTADQRAAFLKWIQNNATGYASTLPYPWSQLGYSYDWSPEAAANNIGLTEFAVLGHKYVGWGGEWAVMYNNFPYKYDGESCPNVEAHAVTSIGSYMYYTRSGANVGNFHVTDVCDTLWVGATYTPVAADAANRAVTVDSTGLVYRGMHVSSPGFTVTNNGIITGRRYGIDKAYYPQTILFSGSGTLNNYGLISATSAGIATAVAVESGSGASLTLNNYGNILGNVTLADGNDTVSTRGGYFLGNIDGGTGTNSFIAEADGRSVVWGSIENFSTVRVDGTLAGQANVVGTLTNHGGVLSPGVTAGSIGTITATSYTESAASRFEIDVAAPGITPGRLNASGVQPNDLVAVTGTAALNSQTTVRVNRVSGSQYTYKQGDSFYFLTANSVTIGGAGPAGKTSITTDTDSAFLSLGVWGAVDGKELHVRVDEVTPFASVATGANNIALAGALDGDLAAAAGDYAAFIGDLEFMTAAEFNERISRLGPGVYHSAAASMRRTTQYMTDNWADYLYSRCGRCVCSLDESDDAEATLRERCSYGKGWNIFTQPFGMFYHERSDADRVGFEANASGVELLVDRWIGESVVTGVGVGYSDTDIGFAEDYGRGELKNVRVGPYLSICKETWFLDAIATYGHHDNEITRNTPLDGAYQGDYGGNDVSLFTAVGRNYRTGRAVISPLVSLQYVYLRQEAFTETGDGGVAFHMDANDLNALRSRVGMRINGCYTLWQTRLTPELSFGWGHEYLATDKLGLQFAGGDTLFESAPPLVFRDSGYVGAGLTMQLRANRRVFCRYDGEFAGTGVFHGVNLGVALAY